MVKFCRKKGVKFGIKAAANSCEVSDKRTLAKLRLNFRKSPRPPIFVRDPRWASPIRACPVFIKLILHTG